MHLHTPCTLLIPDRLYFNAIRTMPASVPDDAHIFSIDNDFAYVPFYAGRSAVLE